MPNYNTSTVLDEHLIPSPTKPFGNKESVLNGFVYLKTINPTLTPRRPSDQLSDSSAVETSSSLGP